MPTVIEPVLITSKEELKSRLQEILDIQRRDSIVAIRGLNLTEEEQLQLAKNLGDLSGWYPNNSELFNHKYVENHSSSSTVQNSTGDEVILKWHLERVDYDDYIPIVAGVWNMRIFNCDQESGKTYFIDSRKIFKEAFSEEEKEFLRKSRSFWQDAESAAARENRTTTVQKHWLTGEEQIRVEVNYPSSIELDTFDGKVPTSDEQFKFNQLINKFCKEVYENEDLRLVHKWQKGDILIPDLFSLAHAVTGGFDPKNREFTGYWCYLSSPTVVGEENTHPSWKGM